MDELYYEIEDVIGEIERQLNLTSEESTTKAIMSEDVWEKLPNWVKEKYLGKLFHHDILENRIMFVHTPKEYNPGVVYGEFLPYVPSDYFIKKTSVEKCLVFSRISVHQENK